MSMYIGHVPFVIAYYLFYNLVTKIVTSFLVDFKKDKKWLCLGLQYAIEMILVIVMCATGHFDGGNVLVPINHYSVLLTLLDILVLVLFVRGNILLNLALRFAYAPIAIVFITSALGNFMVLLNDSVKPVKSCAYLSEWRVYADFIVLTSLGMAIIYVSWKVLIVLMHNKFRAMIAGFVMIIPLIVIMVLPGYQTTSNSFNFISNTKSATYTLALFIVYIVVIFLLYARAQKKLEKDRMRVLECGVETAYSHYTRMAEVIDKNAKWRHDVNNHLQVIEYLPYYNDSEELTEVVGLARKTLSESKKYIMGEYSPDRVLDCMLTLKKREAAELGITVQADVFVPKQLKISEYDIVSLLANLYDNAIEACVKASGEKKIRLNVGKQNNYLMIEIQNSKETNARPIDQGYKTTKADKENHGYGTQIVRELVKKYHGSITAEDEGEKYTVSVMIEAE